ncbi:MAG: NUDIX domain-containing protein [Alphaproteobacteria bacterium]|nr:MAG: NUDIX domain-containing protein [Alphaproteobacteria bacterium]
MTEPTEFYDDYGRATTVTDPALIQKFDTVHVLCHSQGHWLLSVMGMLPDVPEFPGGRANPEESFGANLHREFLEETGLTLPPDIERHVRRRHHQVAPFHARMGGKFFLLNQTYVLIDLPENLREHGPDHRLEWSGSEENRLVWMPDAQMSGITLRHEHGLAWKALRAVEE